MDRYQETILYECVNEFCSLYHQRVEELKEKIKVKKISKGFVFSEIINLLYFKYKKELGYEGNLSGFKSLIVREKNRLRKEKDEFLESQELYEQNLVSDSKEVHMVEWGDDISKLDLESQIKLGLNI